MFAFVVLPGETLLFLVLVSIIAIPVAVLTLMAAKILKTATGNNEPVITNRPPEPPASPYRDQHTV